MSEPSRQQSYANHGHRPYLTWAASIFATAALVIFAGDWLRGVHSGQVGLVLLALSTVALVSISRVYTTKLQNRIIRLEMRLRLMDLLPPDQHGKIDQLTTAQLVGLRFASTPSSPRWSIARLPNACRATTSSARSRTGFRTGSEPRNEECRMTMLQCCGAAVPGFQRLSAQAFGRGFSPAQSATHKQLRTVPRSPDTVRRPMA